MRRGLFLIGQDWEVRIESRTYEVHGGRPGIWRLHDGQFEEEVSMSRKRVQYNRWVLAETVDRI